MLSVQLDAWAGAEMYAQGRGFLDPFDVPCPWRVAAPSAEAADAPDGWELCERRAAAAKRARADADTPASQRRRLDAESAESSVSQSATAVARAVDVAAGSTVLAWTENESALRQAVESLKRQLGEASAASEDTLDGLCASGLRQLVDSCCASPRHAARALSLLDPASLPEPAALALSRAFGDAGCAGHAAAAFVRACLLPRFEALGAKPATRGLISAALGPLKENHAGAVLEQLVLPLLWADRGGAQAEALTRLAKELPLPTLARLVGEMAREGAEGGGGAGAAGEGPWSDAQAALLKEVLSKKPALTGETIGALLARADCNIDATKASLKFGNAVRRASAPSHVPRARVPSLLYYIYIYIYTYIYIYISWRWWLNLPPRDSPARKQAKPAATLCKGSRRAVL